MKPTTPNPSSVLLLNEDQVAELVDASTAIDALRDMFSNWDVARVANVPRRRAAIPGFTLHGMSAADARLNRGAWKQYSTTRQAARFHVGLYDASSGSLLAMMQANRLGQLRTGAICALAAQQLSGRAGVQQAALFGCGWQAESQLECFAQLFPTMQVRVYCRDDVRRNAFAQDMSRRFGLRIEAAPSAQSCAQGADTIITITSAKQPVVEPAWLNQCRLIIAAGSNQPGNAELPASVVHAAARIVVDDLEGCRNEAGDLILAAAQLSDANALWSRAEELANVISGDVTTQQVGRPGNQPRSHPILFKSVGMAASDLALASLIYDRACQRNVGQRIDL